MIVNRLNVGLDPIHFRADVVAMIAEKKQKRPIDSRLNNVSERRAVDVETGLAARIVMAKLSHDSASERVAVPTDTVPVHAGPISSEPCPYTQRQRNTRQRLFRRQLCRAIRLRRCR